MAAGVKAGSQRVRRSGGAAGRKGGGVREVHTPTGAERAFSLVGTGAVPPLHGAPCSTRALCCPFSVQESPCSSHNVK